jgi:hypothetical protein
LYEHGYTEMTMRKIRLAVVAIAVAMTPAKGVEFSEAQRAGINLLAEATFAAVVCPEIDNGWTVDIARIEIFLLAYDVKDMSAALVAEEIPLGKLQPLLEHPSYLGPPPGFCPLFLGKVAGNPNLQRLVGPLKPPRATSSDKDALCEVQAVCLHYQEARQNCATAGSFDKCLEIKMEGYEIPYIISYIDECLDKGRLRDMPPETPTIVECTVRNTGKALKQLVQRTH